MRDVSEYLSRVKALIVLNPRIVQWEIVREEVQGDRAFFRYRLNLRDGGLLEIFELVHIIDGKVQIKKYSFHWQDAMGNLIKRWDNAAHHPEVETYPHHVHNGSDVLPHKPVCAEVILTMIGENEDIA